MYYLAIWFVLAVILNSKSKFIVAKLTVWVWCHVASYNKRTNRLRVYSRLLTNHLHGKAAKLCLANNWNDSVTTTKYIEYINSIPHVSTAPHVSMASYVSTACVTLFITWCW